MNTGNYTQRNIDKSTFNMKMILDNQFKQNSDAIKDLEIQLWKCMDEIKANRYEIKTFPSKEAIERKYELKVEYERLACHYSSCDPFSKTKLKFD